MSLDVYLTLKGVQNLPSLPIIPIREDGRLRNISRDEWDARFPGREPVTVELPSDDETVYSGNITHNLNTMADEAGIYKHLWRPEELGITVANELIIPLREGLQRLKDDPERFKEFNPSNGWGSYEVLVEFVSEYLNACESWPMAEISTWR